jgi:hypothetical protein
MMKSPARPTTFSTFGGMSAAPARGTMIVVGRWGLGKTVFPASSRISSFFGLTVRSGESHPHLMGQFVGKVHRLDSQKYEPYGFYGHFEGESDFAIPVLDLALLRAFQDAFNLSRDIEEPGLSVVIPFPQLELRSEDLVREAIFSYYLPIVQGQLVITVVSDVGTKRIDRETIEAEANIVSWVRSERTLAEMLAQIAFARKCLTIKGSEFDTLEMIGGRHSPALSAECFRDGLIDSLRDRLESGQVVALDVPIAVEKKGVASTSRFRVFLVRDGESHSGKGEFIRQGLTISRIDKPPKAGLRGMVLVEGDTLARLLGDSENPAHTKWLERSGKLKEGGYKHAAATVKCLRNSLVSLSELLARPPAGRDKSALEDFFFIDHPPESQEAHQGGPEDGGEGGGPVFPPGPGGRPSAFAIRRIDGGFKVIGKPGDDPPPQRVIVRCAYDVRRGDPFRRYEPYDFAVDQSPITYSCSGAEVVEATFNKIVLAPEVREFNLEVTGFDSNRDLSIRAEGRAGDTE